jgi:hypothetical protein
MGIYMKEDKKQYIMEKLRVMINRIKRVQENPIIIMFGNMNANNKSKITIIEKTLGLRTSKGNMNIMTRSERNYIDY